MTVIHLVPTAPNRPGRATQRTVGIDIRDDLPTCRRTALSLLKKKQTAKVGIKNKRLMCGWNENYLTKVLFKS